MKKSIVCLLFLTGVALCFARGKQEIIVSENYSSECRNVVVTISNKTEADFQTLVITRKEYLSDKFELTDRRTFSVRSGEAKSVVLDNQGLYKLELFDAKGHKFSKKNAFTQVIKNKQGTIISEGEYQQFTQPWQKLVFTEQDFEPQAVLDIVEVFFGMYGNEKHLDEPDKNCSVIMVNNTGEQIDYISVVLNSTTTRTANLAIGKGQCGVLDIKQSETADISLISHSQHVYTKAGLSFNSENLTVIFTSSDRENDGDKAARFVSSALSSISSVLSITTETFASVLGKTDESSEFVADDASERQIAGGTASNRGNADIAADTVPGKADEAGSAGAGEADAAGAGSAEQAETKKSFWSWLPWVD